MSSRLLAIFLFVFIFNSTCTFAETYFDSRRKKLFDTFNFPIYETTNLNTQQYIWRIKLTHSPDLSSWSTELLNPHPELTLLNRRAIEIAQDEMLQKHVKETLIGRNEILPLDIQIADPNFQPKDEFYVLVEFTRGVTFKKNAFLSATNKSKFQKEVKAICAQPTSNPIFKTHKNSSDTFLEFTLKFEIDVHGKIQSTEIPAYIDEYSKLKDLIQKTSKATTFNITNHYGTPVPFKALQPFSFECPHTSSTP